MKNKVLSFEIFRSSRPPPNGHVVAIDHQLFPVSLAGNLPEHAFYGTRSGAQPGSSGVPSNRSSRISLRTRAIGRSERCSCCSCSADQVASMTELLHEEKLFPDPESSWTFPGHIWKLPSRTAAPTSRAPRASLRFPGTTTVFFFYNEHDVVIQHSRVFHVLRIGISI